jgi:hypothetical protein
MPISPKASWTSFNLESGIIASIFFIIKFVGLFLVRRKLPSGATVPFASAIPMGKSFGEIFCEREETL